jgi:alpha,alpha-trehalase
MNSFRSLTPDHIFGELFRAVQLGRVFTDSKTFVDCVPKSAPTIILADYEAEKHQAGFSLNAFVYEHFTVPEAVVSGFVADTTHSTAEHIGRVWPYLTHRADEVETGKASQQGGSLVPLPYPYVVPGGRFREVFYWDSYFTMLGLRESGQYDLIRQMIDNFAYLIDTYGHIPNGNRTYFLSRSQPPFFSMMVQLLAGIDGSAVLAKYLPQLEQEYAFWMDGATQLSPETPIIKRVVWMPNGSILNRYWDDRHEPRPESYREEIELTKTAEAQGIVPEELYEHIRAACESGWDFSSRWFADGRTMATIQTADLVPVDLNCLIADLEFTLHYAYTLAERKAESDTILAAFMRRMEAIDLFFWNDEAQFFTDFDLKRLTQSDQLTLAGVFPLLINMADDTQTFLTYTRLRQDFLQPGGWVTTLTNTGQQWDSPNGWAPLQWIVYKALADAGEPEEDDTNDMKAVRAAYIKTANEGRDHWLALNDRVFKATGKMMEKYNVVDNTLTAGGGEYENQDGFGWTNGVYLALLNTKTPD